MNKDNAGIWALVGIVAFVALCFSVAIVLSIKSAEDWEKFSQQHHCRLVSHRDAQIISGSDSSGNFTTSTIPAQNGYQCDDGVTYWR